nr:hypothetical protein [Tanacetum cinerariifolium]
MTLEEIKEKFIPVWKQLEDFVPMSLKEEGNFKYQTSYKRQEKELWVELKRLFEPDFEDKLWTYNQALMYVSVEWKLYDTCGIHHVFSKDQEIFMLVEKDYPLRKGLATMMISNRLQYLQNEHYALWEFIEFGDSYKAPSEETGKDPTSESSTKKKGRTAVITTKDMQKRRIIMK